MKAYLDILKLVWPLALGMMNNALLQFTDRAFLARESMASLEAVLAASMLAYVVLGFFQSVVGYAGTFVAQYFGAKNLAMCRRSYFAGTVIALVSGTIVLLALPLGDWAFESFSNGSDVIARQKTYYNICTAGGVFLFGQMAAQSFFTGLGRTRIVLWVNIIGNVLNVALDPLLIFGLMGFPKLGIAGAAYATVFATAVQWAILAVAARRYLATLDLQSPSPSNLSSFPNLLSRILRYGVPAGLYTVLNSLSFTIFVFFTGTVGHVEAAVSNAVFSICYLLFAPMEGFALGAATLVGHDRGRGDDAAAMRTGWRTLLLGCLFSVTVSSIAVLFRHPLLAIYAPPDVAASMQFHEIGAVLFVMMGAWQVFDAADTIVAGALKGAGDTKFVMGWMLIVGFVLWLPLVWFVFRIHNSMVALWGTLIFYVVVLCVGTLWRWWRGSWRCQRIV